MFHLASDLPAVLSWLPSDELPLVATAELIFLLLLMLVLALYMDEVVQP